MDCNDGIIALKKKFLVIEKMYYTENFHIALKNLREQIK